MPHMVNFDDVSTVGLESSPVAEALAGLRANEARYYRNKYEHVFTVSPASEDVPEELAERFKFARQKSKPAGVIRGSFFVIKGEY